MNKKLLKIYIWILTDNMPQGTAIQIMKIIVIEIGNFERQGIKIVDKSAETIFVDKFSGILDKDIYLFKLNYKLKPENPNIQLGEGFFIEDGWLHKTGITASKYLAYIDERDSLRNIIIFSGPDDLNTPAERELALREVLEMSGLISK